MYAVAIGDPLDDLPHSTPHGERFMDPPFFPRWKSRVSLGRIYERREKRFSLPPLSARGKERQRMWSNPERVTIFPVSLDRVFAV